eukprot:6833086-Pyramimonas_sp.AAC.1
MKRPVDSDALPAPAAARERGRVTEARQIGRSANDPSTATATMTTTTRRTTDDGDDGDEADARCAVHA